MACCPATRFMLDERWQLRACPPAVAFPLRPRKDCAWPWKQRHLTASPGTCTPCVPVAGCLDCLPARGRVGCLACWMKRGHRQGVGMGAIVATTPGSASGTEKGSARAVSPAVVSRVVRRTVAAAATRRAVCQRMPRATRPAASAASPVPFAQRRSSVKMATVPASILAASVIRRPDRISVATSNRPPATLARRNRAVSAAWWMELPAWRPPTRRVYRVRAAAAAASAAGTTPARRPRDLADGDLGQKRYLTEAVVPQRRARELDGAPLRNAGDLPHPGIIRLRNSGDDQPLVRNLSGQGARSSPCHSPAVKRHKPNEGKDGAGGIEGHAQPVQLLELLGSLPQDLR